MWSAAKHRTIGHPADLCIGRSPTLPSRPGGRWQRDRDALAQGRIQRVVISRQKPHRKKRRRKGHPTKVAVPPR